MRLRQQPEITDRSGNPPAPRVTKRQFGAKNAALAGSLGRQMDPSILDGYDPQGFYCEMLRSAASQVDPRAPRRPVDRCAQRARRRRQRRALQSRHHLHGLLRREDDRPHPAVRRRSRASCRPRSGGTSSAASSSGSPRSTCCSTTSITSSTILRDGVVPADLVLGNRNYRPLMRGIDLPHKTYVNICGTDIVRDERRHVPRARGQRAHPLRASATSSRTGT